MKLLMRSLIAAGGLTAGVALFAHDATATAITGTNLDFEAPVPGSLTPGSDQNESANFGTAAIPGWTINNPAITSFTGNAGVWAPNPSGNFTGTTWQGNQVGFMTTGSAISQNLNGIINGNGGTVAVTLLLGQTNTSPINPALGGLTLLANGVTIGATELFSNAVSYTAPGLGQFASETYDFTLGVGNYTGETLGLALGNFTDPSNEFVDNITVDGGTAVDPISPSSIPEPPAGLPLLGISLLGFVAYHYRQKTKLLAL